MPAINSNVLTMMDWAKRLDPDGKTAFITEVLSQNNEVLDDMLFKEGNEPTGERTTIRTGLPNVFYRLINQGTPKSKSTTAQIVETAAILAARSELDVDEAMLNGNTNEYRLSESMAFMEAMAQQQAETLFYGTAANPEEYVGFTPRYDDLSAPNAQNILDAGGTGSDNSSIWLVGWGERTVFGVFPKGSQAGLSHKDLGEIDAFDSNNDRFRAFADEYKWKNGLVVKDWRYAVRIANIDIPELEAQTGTQADTAATAIIKLISRSIDRLPSRTNVRKSFYTNRTVMSLLRVAALDKSQNAVKIEESTNQFGDTIDNMTVYGITVKMVDRLLETEARVV